MKTALGRAMMLALAILAMTPWTARAGDITLEGLNFNSLVNSDITKEDLQGKVVMVEFWGTK